MLQVRNLRKSYGAATVLADVNFTLDDGDHVGLIGSNGTGKSTLLRCIVGDEQPDAGSITISPSGAAVGYLPQALNDLSDLTLGQAIATARADLVDAEEALGQASEALASSADPTAALAAYDSALTRFEALGGYERE
jgi:ATP-binding cassette subfamily F protein 3